MAQSCTVLTRPSLFFCYTFQFLSRHLTFFLGPFSLSSRHILIPQFFIPLYPQPSSLLTELRRTYRFLLPVPIVRSVLPAFPSLPSCLNTALRTVVYLCFEEYFVIAPISQTPSFRSPPQFGLCFVSAVSSFCMSPTSGPIL